MVNSSISQNMALLINLSNAAHWHKNNCQDASCNVSLFQLKQTAEMMIARYYFRKDEMEEAIKLVKEMPIV